MSLRCEVRGIWCLAVTLLTLPGGAPSALERAPQTDPTPHLINQGVLQTLLKGALSEALCDHCSAARQSSNWRCGCPAGFTSCGGRCYALLDQVVEYQRAERECAALGAHLAVPRSRDQILCVAGLAQNKGAWLGITDREQEGVFQGADGRPVINEGLPWGDTQPNDHGGKEDCVEIRKMSSSFRFGQWNDWKCTGVKDYPLCQLR